MKILKQKLFIHITIVSLLLITFNSISPVTIQTKTGKKYKGEIIKETVNEITIFYKGDNKDINNHKITIQKSNIEFIDRKKLQEKKYKNSYPVAGITLGTPAGLNLVFGYYFSKFNIKISGLYMDTMYGAQIKLGYALINTRKTVHGLFIGGGTTFIASGQSNLDPSTWNYVGAGYYLNANGFYLEVGLSVGEGTFPNPQALLQLGYVKRFNIAK